MALLTSSSAAVVNKSVKLGKDPVAIGRHPDCEVQVDDGSVSRQHARVVYERSDYYLEDLNSRNGTLLNNQYIAGKTKLFDGAEIQICDVVFTFTRSSVSYDRHRRPTALTDSRSVESVEPTIDDSFFLEHSPSSSSEVVSQLEIPSHHHRMHVHVTADDKLKALINITHTLSEAVDQTEILEKILNFLFDLFVQSDRGIVMLKDEAGELRPLASKSRRPEFDEHIRISSTIANRVMESKRPIISRDASLDDRFGAKESIIDFQLRSIMCAPLINSRETAIGVIQLDTLRQAVAFREEDLELLVTVAMQASLAIQKADLFEEQKKNLELKSDLQLAHELQQRFLPQIAPESESYDLFSWYRPMQQVGGDYFDYISLPDNRTGIVVADVVGHGVAAAMLMAKVSAESRFALATEQDPVRAIQRMNRSLSSMHIDRFVTLVLAILDENENSLTIVNAGHMAPIVRRSDDASIVSMGIEKSGVPLGVVADFEYESETLAMNSGDVVLLYTDGISEAMDSDGNQLTTDGLIEEIRTSQAKSPEMIGEVICEAVARHCGSHPAIDDMCLVCIGRNLV